MSNDKAAAAAATDKAATAATATASRKKQMVESLQMELDVTERARCVTGHYVRKAQRAERTVRIKKRKLLEKQDIEEQAEVVADTEGRTRGVMAALNGGVVDGSRIFGAGGISQKTPNEARNGAEGAASGTRDKSYGQLVKELRFKSGDAPDSTERDSGSSKVSQNESQPKSPRIENEEQPKKRRHYKMKGFSSERMADKHGDAIYAHARGRTREAIQKLQQVARDAPSAPQVYSFLGMVYADVLRESEKNANEGNTKDEKEEPNQVGDAQPDLENDCAPTTLSEKISVAKKSYGSFHVAALLCKKDYTLWVRASDAAMVVSDLNYQAAVDVGLGENEKNQYFAASRRSLEEALKDLIMADKLKPAGMEVPAKLAALHTELGNLSEALTILTALKNEPFDAESRQCNEFYSSYRAWMLFADLQLRIGYECTQWNKGSRKNSNFNFRKWLRKYSTSFDWQERRLQALSLAFEAAAGSASTSMYIDWILKRFSKLSTQSVDRENAAKRSPDSFAATSKGQKESSGQNESREAASVEPGGKDVPKLTPDEGLQETPVNAKDKSASTSKVQGDGGSIEYGCSGLDRPDLPVSASVTTVCIIASQLMKHLLGLNLFEGCAVVGQCTSAYLRLRASMVVSQKNSKLSMHQSELGPLDHRDYDDLDFSVSDDGNSSENLMCLSDNEELEASESATGDGRQLFESFERGMLPPEIKLLFCLSLIGQDKFDYAAKNFAKALDELEQEDKLWLLNDVMDPFDPSWSLFEMAMTSSLGRTTAYAFVADVLRKTRRENKWVAHFAPKFRQYLISMEDAGLMDGLSVSHNSDSPLVAFRSNQVLKVILATIRFELIEASNPFAGKDGNGKQSSFLPSISYLNRFLFLIWKIQPNGYLTQSCTEVVDIYSRYFSHKLPDPKNKFYISNLRSTAEEMRPVLSLLTGGAPLPKVNEREDSTEKKTIEERGWTSLPVSSDWQKEHARAVSLRVYNLCTACSVAVFSGWDVNEFSLRVLRRRLGVINLGVAATKGKIKGRLPQFVEKELSVQWKKLSNLLPAFGPSSFDDMIQKAKSSHWYQEISGPDSEKFPSQTIKFKELDGLRIFLQYSSCCLDLLLQGGLESHVWSSLMESSLSIILPMFQFCLDITIWDSTIGDDSVAHSGFEEWYAASGSTYPGVGGFGTSSRRKKSSSGAKVANHPKQSMHGLVHISTHFVNEVWKKESSVQQQQQQQQQQQRRSSDDVMRRLNTTARNLRGCYTESSVEKFGTNLATLLLEAASQPDCYNPFQCIQQAAIFASLGMKKGTVDESFRRAVPPALEECTPDEALVILGRAECFHCCHFPEEAAFLCSYVARACQRRRRTSFLFTTKWRIVSAMNYNLSVMIRLTVDGVIGKSVRADYFSRYGDGDEVALELERGRRDAIHFKQTMMGKSTTPDEEEESEEEDVEFEIMDANDDDDDDDDPLSTAFDEPVNDDDVDVVEPSTPSTTAFVAPVDDDDVAEPSIDEMVEPVGYAPLDVEDIGLAPSVSAAAKAAPLDVWVDTDGVTMYEV